MYCRTLFRRIASISNSKALFLSILALPVVAFGETVGDPHVSVSGDITASGEVSGSEVSTDYQFNFDNSSGSGSLLIASGPSPLLRFVGYSVHLGKGSGGPNMTGSFNYLIGHQAGQNITTGAGNFAVGYGALKNNTTGDYNIALGGGVMGGANYGNGNIAMGPGGVLSSNQGNYNIAMGFRAMFTNVTGYNNIAIGSDAMRNSNSAADPAVVRFNLAMSTYALGEVDIGAYNVGLGWFAGRNIVEGSYNVFLGPSAGAGMISGNYNTLLGPFSGGGLVSGDQNIGIGYNIAFPNSEADKQLNIGNTIYGDLATDKVGIGYATPAQTLHVGGNAQVEGSLILTDAASSATVGALRWSGSDFEGYDGVDWVSLTGIPPVGDISETNELVSGLSLSGSILTLVDPGNTFNVDLSSLGYLTAEADGSDVNETITAVALSGTSLIITEAGVDQSVDLAPLIPDIADNSSLDSPDGNVDVLVVSNNERVGIGVESPLEKLHVDGSARVDGILRVDDEINFTNVSGSNYFGILNGQAPLLRFVDYSLTLGKGAGNPTMTGGNNYVIGNHAGGNLTTGSGNFAVGYRSLVSETTGSHNIAIGSRTMEGASGGSNNVAIGGGLDANQGNNNIAIGSAAMNQNVTGINNVAIGSNAMGNSNSSADPAIVYGNNALGSGALRDIDNGHYNLALGERAGQDLTDGVGNVFVGLFAGVSSGEYNTLLGAQSGEGLNSGDKNIGIGYNLSFPNADGDQQLNIGNTIYGDLATDRVGIGYAMPAQTLHVGGNAQVEGSLILTDAASSATVGALRWSGSDFEGYVGDEWVSLTGVPAVGDISNSNELVTTFSLSGTDLTIEEGGVTHTVSLAGISDDGAYFGQTGDDIYFETGKLGIGTNTPVYALDVLGDSRVSGSLIVTGDLKTSTDNVYYHGGNLDSDAVKAALGLQSSDVLVYMNSAGNGDWGIGNTFSGAVNSKALGNANTLEGPFTFVWGGSNTVTDTYATAWGLDNTAGRHATAWGEGNKAESFKSTAFGRFNIGGVGSGGDTAWLVTDPLLEIGIGADSVSRANAITVLKDARIALGKHVALPVTASETVQVQGPILIQDYSADLIAGGFDPATQATPGTIRWTGTDFEGYANSEWVSLTSGGFENQTFTFTNGVLAITDANSTLSVDISGLQSSSSSSLSWPDGPLTDAVQALDTGVVVVNAPLGVGTNTPGDGLQMQVAGDVKIEGALEVASFKLTRRGDVYMGQFGRAELGDQVAP